MDRTNVRMTLSRIVLFTAAWAAATPNNAAAQSFTTIDVPGAVETRAHGISDPGEIVGFYNTSSSGPFHGYLRTTDGTFTTFDVPGASETRPQSINASGDIVGDYGDAQGTHGFLRNRSDGTFATLDVPGADLTVAFGINNQGDIGGTYQSAGVFHGFVWFADGNLVTIDFPGAASTIASIINERGDISGAYFDASGVEHGYFNLASAGVFTSFDVPGTVGTEGHAINERGEIVGPDCLDPSCPLGVPHGFLRLNDGTFIDIAYPGAAATLAGWIDNSGKIVGDYFTFDFKRHGFLRAP